MPVNDDVPFIFCSTDGQDFPSPLASFEARSLSPSSNTVPLKNHDKSSNTHLNSSLEGDEEMETEDDDENENAKPPYKKPLITQSKGGNERRQYLADGSQIRTNPQRPQQPQILKQPPPPPPNGNNNSLPSSSQSSISNRSPQSNPTNKYSDYGPFPDEQKQRLKKPPQQEIEMLSPARSTAPENYDADDELRRHAKATERIRALLEVSSDEDVEYETLLRQQQQLQRKQINQSAFRLHSYAQSPAAIRRNNNEDGGLQTDDSSEEMESDEEDEDTSNNKSDSDAGLMYPTTTAGGGFNSLHQLLDFETEGLHALAEESENTYSEHEPVAVVDSGDENKVGHDDYGDGNEGVEAYRYQNHDFIGLYNYVVPRENSEVAHISGGGGGTVVSGDFYFDVDEEPHYEGTGMHGQEKQGIGLLRYEGGQQPTVQSTGSRRPILPPPPPLADDDDDVVQADANLAAGGTSEEESLDALSPTSLASALSPKGSFRNNAPQSTLEDLKFIEEQIASANAEEDLLKIADELGLLSDSGNNIVLDSSDENDHVEEEIQEDKVVAADPKEDETPPDEHHKKGFSIGTFLSVCLGAVMLLVGLLIAVGVIGNTNTHQAEADSAHGESSAHPICPRVSHYLIRTATVSVDFFAFTNNLLLDSRQAENLANIFTASYNGAIGDCVTDPYSRRIVNTTLACSKPPTAAFKATDTHTDDHAADTSANQAVDVGTTCCEKIQSALYGTVFRCNFTSAVHWDTDATHLFTDQVATTGHAAEADVASSNGHRYMSSAEGNTPDETHHAAEPTSAPASENDHSDKNETGSSQHADATGSETETGSSHDSDATGSGNETGSSHHSSETGSEKDTGSSHDVIVNSNAPGSQNVPVVRFLNLLEIGCINLDVCEAGVKPAIAEMLTTDNMFYTDVKAYTLPNPLVILAAPATTPNQTSVPTQSPHTPSAHSPTPRPVTRAPVTRPTNVSRTRAPSTSRPTNNTVPTSKPTYIRATSKPTSVPATPRPTRRPTVLPTNDPTTKMPVRNTRRPTRAPTRRPTTKPVSAYPSVRQTTPPCNGSICVPSSCVGPSCIFFAQDDNGNATAPLKEYANSDAKAQEFYQLLEKIDLQVFDSIANGTKLPLYVKSFLSSGPATISGTGLSTAVTSVVKNGCYPISGTQYLRVAADEMLEIVFSTTIYAFGMFASNLAAQSGGLFISTETSSGENRVDYAVPVRRSNGAAIGAVTFFAIYDANGFRRVYLVNDSNEFGLDTLSISASRLRAYNGR